MGKYTVVTTDNFEREFERLQRKYPKMDDDFEEFLDDIEENDNLGDSYPGVVKDGNKVYKKRMRNTSARKGLSGGFRVIEYLVTSHNVVFLLDIYSKNVQEDIPKKRINDLINMNESYIEEILKEFGIEIKDPPTG